MAEIETRELLGGPRENNKIPDERSIFCPPGKSIFFSKSKRNKIALEARPGSCPVHDLARVYQVGHGPHHLLQRAVGVVFVDDKEVDVLKTKVVQRSF